MGFAVGERDGTRVGFVGFRVGVFVGVFVDSYVGEEEGTPVSFIVGEREGLFVRRVGERVGETVGTSVKSSEGAATGEELDRRFLRVGRGVGRTVGIRVSYSYSYSYSLSHASTSSTIARANRVARRADVRACMGVVFPTNETLIYATLRPSPPSSKEVLEVIILGEVGLYEPLLLRRVAHLSWLGKISTSEIRLRIALFSVSLT